jgi:metal-responsive CopG/Arc/MetJ family transcriptional regulator
MMKNQINFKADDALLTLLEAYAVKHKMSKSEVVRLALQKFLEDEFKKEKIKEIKVEKGEKLF